MSEDWSETEDPVTLCVGCKKADPSGLCADCLDDCIAGFKSLAEELELRPAAPEEKP